MTRPVLALLVATLRRRSRSVAALAVWTAVEALPALAFGRAIAGATDAFVARHVVAGLEWLALLVAAAAAGAVGSRLVYGRVAAIVEPVRDDLVRRVVDGALRRSIEAGAPPDTAAVSRITNQVEIVRDTLGGMVTIVGTFVFTAAGALVGLVTLAPVGAAFVVPPLIAALALFAAMLRNAARRQRRLILADEAVAETASEVVEALRDVVACGAENDVGWLIDARVDEQARTARAVARLAAARTLALALGGWLPLVALLAATPWLAGRGLTAGAILGILAYVRGGLQPALGTLVQGVGGSGMRLAVTLQRIAETENAPAPPSAMGGGAARALPGGHYLELDRLTFAYGPGADPVIANLDLAIPEGDHLAVVGPSGIGKSTLANLLCGVLAPLSGEVRVGGAALGDLDRAAWVRDRALIPQEAYVFAGTLGENLSYLAPGATVAELDGAVEAIGVGALRERLGGYAAPLTPATLSAGERQLIALARAFLSPARLIVLDEATCHLDPSAEARAERAFALRPGTLVVVAHRVSSALRARRILVLDGTTAVVGVHQSLLATSTLYRDLVGHWGAGAAPVERHRLPVDA